MLLKLAIINKQINKNTEIIKFQIYIMYITYIYICTSMALRSLSIDSDIDKIWKEWTGDNIIST
jgi:hypothetical protein